MYMNYTPLSKFFYQDKQLFEEIYNDRFNSVSTEKFNFKIGDNQAFIVITNELLCLTEQIYFLDKKLDSFTNCIPNIALMQYTKKCLVDEVHLTNEIEGVCSTRKEINDILNSIDSKESKRRLYGLVQKYNMLSNESIQLKSCQDIRNLYNELVLPEVIEEDKDNLPDGQYFRKDHTYVIGKHDKPIHSGIFPEEKVISLMNKSLELLNNNSYSFLIRIAIFHYLFGHIHPFYDGNGRTSRFISSYLLSQNLNRLVSYSLSYTIKSNIAQYYKSFKITNDDTNKGDLTPFVLNFLETICKVYENLEKSLEERTNKLKFYGEITQKIAGEDNDFGKLVFILFQNSLFGEKGIEMSELKESLPYNENKIRNYLKKLESEKLLIINKNSRRYLYDIDLSKAKLI